MAENQSSRYVPNEFVMLSLTDFIISSSLISDRVTEYLVPFFRRYSELRRNNFSSIRSISLPYTKPFPILSLVYRQSNPVIKKRREYERRCFLVLSAPFTAVAYPDQSRSLPAFSQDDELSSPTPLMPLKSPLCAFSGILEGGGMTGSIL